MATRDGCGRRRVLFAGQVQGVGFRYRTQHVAQRFRVSGFVRNLGDGRVELVAEGESDELDRFVAAVQSEMKEYIAGMDVENSPTTQSFHGFEIRI